MIGVTNKICPDGNVIYYGESSIEVRKRGLHTSRVHAIKRAIRHSARICACHYQKNPIMGKEPGFVATSKISKGTVYKYTAGGAAFKKCQILLETSIPQKLSPYEKLRASRKNQQRATFALQNVQGRKCTPVLGNVITSLLPLGASNSGKLFFKALSIIHSCQPTA